MSSPSDWAFLPLGYLATVAIETPVLIVCLSRRHPLVDRVTAGFWLNACSYPIVVVAMPALLATAPRWLFLAIAESFAPIAECTLFWLAYGRREDRWKWSMWQDMAAVTLANLASFIIGEWGGLSDWLGRLLVK